MGETDPLKATREVVLYVRSKESITSVKHLDPKELQIEGPMVAASTQVFKSHQGSPDSVARETDAVQKERTLPDDQARIVSLVEGIALKRGYVVRTVDVGKENVLHQYLQTHLKGVKQFPFLWLSHSPGRLEGPSAFSRAKLEELLPP